MSDQPTRRRNIRRTIAAEKRGAPQDAPCTGRRWPVWMAGMRRAAIHGPKRGPGSGGSGKPDTTTRARQYRIAPPGRRPNPKLPAQQSRFRHTGGKLTDLLRLRGGTR